MKQYDYADAEQRTKSIRRMRERLRQKRQTKAMTKESRRNSALAQPSAVDQIPIIVRDESEYIHYPASPDDIRSILCALPRGVTDGLTSIELCLGEKDQVRSEMKWGDTEHDPYVGRKGDEILPGVFLGDVVGTYHPGQAKIRINAYVCEEASLSPIQVRFYLLMHMLMTLVHEIAHHYDLSARVARGRWLADDVEKGEIYAEHVQHDWFNRYVVPTLMKDYSDQWDAFGEWAQEKIGLSLPVEMLLGDPRATAKGNRITTRGLFDTGYAFQDFVTALHEARDSRRARLEFAEALHWAKYYEPALRIIDLLLKNDRDDIDALVLQADIFNHMSRYEEALSISKRVLQRESSWEGALETRADALMGLKRYDEAIETIDRLLAIVGKIPWKAALWQEEKAEALIELGQYAEAAGVVSVLEELTAGRRSWKRRIERLRKKCRTRRRRELGKDPT